MPLFTFLSKVFRSGNRAETKDYKNNRGYKAELMREVIQAKREIQEIRAKKTAMPFWNSLNTGIFKRYPPFKKWGILIEKYPNKYSKLVGLCDKMGSALARLTKLVARIKADKEVLGIPDKTLRELELARVQIRTDLLLLRGSAFVDHIESSSAQQARVTQMRRAA